MEITIQIEGKKYQLATKEHVKAVYEKFKKGPASTQSYTSQEPLFELLVDSFEKDLYQKHGITSRFLGEELKKKLVQGKKYITDDQGFAKKTVQSLKKTIEKLDKELFLKAAPLSELTHNDKDKGKNTYVFLTKPRHDKYAGCEVQALVERIVLEKTTAFVGREEELERLDNFVQENSCGYLIVTARAGFGKTSLLANWLAARQNEGPFIAYHFFNSQYPSTSSITQAYLNLFRQLSLYYELTDQPIPRDENTLRETLYGTIAEQGASEGKPLVIIIDALDEAERHFPPPFPVPLPEGIFIIASARADENEEPEYLRGWTDGASIVHLKRLARPAIADWLRRAGTGELARFAEDQSLISRLDEITEGFPLFVSFLVDEMIHRVAAKEDVNTVLTRSPRGFSPYVREHLHLMAKEERVRRHKEVQQLFALLSVAQEALSEEDVEELTELTVFELQALPWQVRRWFIIHAVKSNKFFYSFAHPQLAKEFEKSMGRQTDKARNTLIEYCSRWDEHYSSYALRQYGQHLYNEKQWNELFELARSRVFAEAQREYLTEEPDQPLKTVRTALLAAAEINDAGKMAEFLLSHLQRYRQITEETPLKALRNSSLERALSIADLYDFDFCTLWCLLLCWELKDEGKSKELDVTLDRLLHRDSKRLSPWEGRYAANLIAMIVGAAPEACSTLAGRLLGDSDKATVCKILAHDGQFEVALRVLKSIQEDLYRSDALDGVLSTEALEKYPEAKHSVLSAVQDISNEIEDEGYRLGALVNIIQTKAEIGDIQSACETFAMGIESVSGPKLSPFKCAGSLEIAEAQARAGETRAAFATVGTLREPIEDLQPEDKDLFLMRTASVQAQLGDFVAATETIKTIDKEINKVWGLGSIAEIHCKDRDTEAVRSIMNSALEIAQRITNAEERIQAFVIVVTIQLLLGEIQSALKTAREIVDEKGFSEALSIIAAAQAHEKQFSEAYETALSIPEKYEKAKALAAVSKACSEAGEIDKGRSIFTNALEVAKEIEREWEQAEAFEKIAQSAAKTEDLASLLEAIKDMSEEFHRANSVKAIAEAQAQLGNPQGARTTIASFLDEVGRKGLEFWQEWECDYGLLAIAETLAKVGQFDSALEIAMGIETVSGRVKAFTAIAEKQVSLGELESANTTFGRAKQVVFEHSCGSSLVRDLLVVASAQARAGDQKSSKETFAAALKTAKEIEEEDDRVSALAAVAEELFVSGEPGEAQGIAMSALESAERIHTKKEQVDALVRIASAQAKSGDERSVKHTLKIATDCAKMIERDLDRAFALDKITQTLSEVKEFPLAIRTAREIPEKFVEAGSLARIATAQIEAGEREEADVTFSAAMEVAKNIESESQRSYVLENISTGLALAGKFSNSLSIAEGIEVGHHRHPALANIAAALAKAGYGDEGVRLEQRIPTPRDHSIQKIAGSLAEIKDIENFKRLLIPSAFYKNTVYKMCGFLAFLYPEQAEAIARVIKRENNDN